jgi:hypothetical protein
MFSFLQLIVAFELQNRIPIFDQTTRSSARSAGSGFKNRRE